MKARIEEIVRDEDGDYKRVPLAPTARVETWDLPDTIAGQFEMEQELWLEPDRPTATDPRRPVVILAIRYIAICDEDEIGMMLDVCADYIRDEIGEALNGETGKRNPIYQRQYIAWAIDHKVWP